MQNHSVWFGSMLVVLGPIALQGAGQTVPFVTPPPDAPTVKCKVTPSKDISNLRVLSGAEPLVQVLNCSREPEDCPALRYTPGSKDLPSYSVAEVDHTQGNWSCVSLNGDASWVPTDRLAALPFLPEIGEQFWLGWWRLPHEVTGRKNNRLLIVPGDGAGNLHISGRAYWYGANDNVHFGDIDTVASISGQYLHAVQGTGPGACVLDLVAQPVKRTFIGLDNMNCGGMNVRFWGEWHRFTPTGSERSH